MCYTEPKTSTFKAYETLDRKRGAMRNIAFTVFGFPIYWYGLMILIGVLCATFVATKLSRLRGYSSEMVMDFLLLALPFGIVGARLYDVAFEWDYFRHHLDEIFTLRMSGLAIYGAVIGGLIAAVVICKWRKLSFWDLVDPAMPGLILAQAIGRWGNYFNQELYGAALEGVSGKLLPDLALFPPAVLVGGQWHVALFLIESLLNIGVFAALMLLWKKKPQLRGGAFWGYVTLYGGVRAVLEGLRLPQFILMWGPFKVSQVLSVVMALVGAFMLVRIAKNGGYPKREIPAVYELKK
jgi:phosphatidylglycerol:prolipoprotein diacylglycerol transferase